MNAATFLAGAQVTLGGSGIGQQAKSLIRVQSENDVIKPFEPRRTIDEHRAVDGIAAHPANRTADPTSRQERRGHRVHVLPRAAHNRAPLWTLAQIKHPVIVEEAEEEAGRELHHRFVRRGPDCGAIRARCQATACRYARREAPRCRPN